MIAVKDEEIDSEDTSSVSSINSSESDIDLSM